MRKLTRVALVLAAVGCVAAGCAVGASGSAGTLVVYPDYPAAVERDHAYQVRVVQGGNVRPLVVWNHCEKSALRDRTHGGDVNRRFCEFAFDGAPVRVDIAVRRDVKCYKVFPARLGLRHEFKDGFISVWLDRPAYFGVQVNDSDKSILSVFADAPETDVPQKGAEGVVYVDGWVDAPGEDGVIEYGPETKEIYIAPGAVLNARLKIKGPNTRLHGRGMVLDPMSDIFRYNQGKNPSRGLVAFSAPGCEAEGVKLVDARTFNFIGWNKGLRYRNVKVLASMMCSDGFTNGGEDLLVDNAWVYVGDNALVVSGVKNAVYRNIALGTSCAAIFPQGTNRNVLMEDVSVFRADDGAINNWHNGALRRNNKWNEMNGGLQKKEPDPQDYAPQGQDFRFRNFSAVDTTLFSKFFSGRNMGSLPKTFVFDGVSIPYATGRSHWEAIGRTNGLSVVVQNDPKRWLNTVNYTVSITNLYLGGVKVDAFPAYAVKSQTNELALTVVKTAAAPSVPLGPARVEVGWTCPDKRKEKPQPRMGNLLEDRAATRSIWQRCPSWMVKLDAIERDEGGRVVYRFTQCEKGAGMQAVVTERFRATGNGRYRAAFEAKAKSENPFGLRVTMTTNEKTVGQTIPDVELNGGWKRYELEFDCDFDMTKFDLMSFGVFTTATADEVLFRNLTLSKVE